MSVGAPALRDAARFWEPRRLYFNAVLVSVVVLSVVANSAALVAGHPWRLLPILSVLGLVANACYSMAYLPEWLLRRRGAVSLPDAWRWTLWVLGTGIAAVLAAYWLLDEVLPGVGR
jgi:hypothetical protein